MLLGCIACSDSSLLLKMD